MKFLFFDENNKLREFFKSIPLMDLSPYFMKIVKHYGDIERKESNKELLRRYNNREYNDRDRLDIKIMITRSDFKHLEFLERDMVKLILIDDEGKFGEITNFYSLSSLYELFKTINSLKFPFIKKAFQLKINSYIEAKQFSELKELIDLGYTDFFSEKELTMLNKHKNL
ncbi:MAG: hypothetical protein JXA99_07055 [Candidatus Lokiarchaeota archaeon]|nr:hypothetical protein [Candidatus Lokiarchaeota archaeon]